MIIEEVVISEGTRIAKEEGFELLKKEKIIQIVCQNGAKQPYNERLRY